MIEQAPKVVTWIKVEKPNLDIVGLVMKSLATTSVLALLAILAGVVLGLLLIRRRRRAASLGGAHLTQLDLPGHAAEGRGPAA